ncbi:hypothetical protein JL720_4764 [Aureococcus anophagefferens]|nr:hypothetical protein JL720_4764 [Aureococcus anophagefferens]
MSQQPPAMERVVGEVMELTQCTEARARRALEAEGWHLNSAVNAILVESCMSPSSRGASSRRTTSSSRGAASRTGSRAPCGGAGPRRTTRGAPLRARERRRDRRGDARGHGREPGSGLTAGEERAMVERLAAHTDCTRAEARGALAAAKWHEGRAAETLLPDLLYLSPKKDAAQAAKIRQVADIGRCSAEDAARARGERLGPALVAAAGQEKRAKFPTSKAPISAVFHSFWLIFGRAIISRNVAVALGAVAAKGADRRVEDAKVAQVVEIAAVSEAWAKLALESCRWDVSAACAFVLSQPTTGGTPNLPAPPDDDDAPRTTTPRDAAALADADRFAACQIQAARRALAALRRGAAPADRRADRGGQRLPARGARRRRARGGGGGGDAAARRWPPRRRGRERRAAEAERRAAEDERRAAEAAAFRRANEDAEARRRIQEEAEAEVAAPAAAERPGDAGEGRGGGASRSYRSAAPRPRKPRQRILKTINGAQYERVGGGWAPVFASSKLWSSADEKRRRRKSSDKLPAVPGALPPLARRDAAAAAARDEQRSSSAKSKRLPALGAGLPQMHPPRRSSAPVAT